MNDYQNNLYNDLMALCKDSKTFYFADVQCDVSSAWFRIFNYRMAGYMEFQAPSGLECRGHMFQISEEGDDAKMIRLAALPMEKFFNLNENPATMDLDLSTVNMIEDKADGSLISSYFVNVDGEFGMPETLVRMKSKGSLSSDQAQAAMRYLMKPENLEYAHQLRTYTILHYTVNLEWCAPDNRIVLGYEEPELRVLNIRNNMTGEYVDKEDVNEMYTEIHNHWTERVETDDPVAFVASIPAMTKIEGYVVRLDSGQRVKIKTEWYIALHRTKDNINSPRRLFEACIEEATDDMKSLFHDDPLAIKTIEEMEVFAAEKYNTLADSVTEYYKANKELDRKEYAIKGKEELTPMQFGLAMSMYLGRDPDFKAACKKAWKFYGLTDGDEE